MTRYPFYHKLTIQHRTVIKCQPIDRNIRVKLKFTSAKQLLFKRHLYQLGIKSLTKCFLSLFVSDSISEWFICEWLPGKHLCCQRKGCYSERSSPRHICRSLWTLLKLFCADWCLGNLTFVSDRAFGIGCFQFVVRLYQRRRQVNLRQKQLVWMLRALRTQFCPQCVET